MSEWSVWSQCSCLSQRQQRYRVALSPATRGQQCAPVETQSRTCGHSQCDGESTSQLLLTVTHRHTADKTLFISLSVHVRYFIYSFLFPHVYRL